MVNLEVMISIPEDEIINFSLNNIDNHQFIKDSNTNDIVINNLITQLLICLIIISAILLLYTPYSFPFLSLFITILGIFRLNIYLNRIH